MTKNPVYNALCAILYIVVGVTTVFYGSNYLEGVIEETIFLPMAFLATLVLSVALMAYLFFYEPVMLFLDGKREEAVSFFLRTIAMFAIFTAIVFLLAFVVGALGITSLK